LIISIEEEKAFERIQHYSMINALMRLGTEGMHCNLIKAVYDKPIANITLNGENLKPPPLKSGGGHGCPLSSLTQHSPGTIR
jgi:hypothetical protein